jgi:hypothetical protein
MTEGDVDLVPAYYPVKHELEVEMVPVTIATRDKTPLLLPWCSLSDETSQ